jgi:hypothetical protein
MINKPSVTTDQNSIMEKESIESFKLLTPSKINNKNNYIFQNFYPKFTSSSPQEKNKLLRKKRKMSDLCSGFSTTIAKESPFKTNRLVQSPFITETKITSYFHQKKNNSYQSKHSNSNLQTAYKSGNESSMSSSSKLTFAKRLLFDDLDKANFNPCDNLSVGQNLEISMPKFFENKDGGIMDHHDRMSYLNPNKENIINEKESLSNLMYRLTPKISFKTQNLLSKMNICKEKENTQNKNLNLNFQKIIINNNYRKKEKNYPKKPKTNNYSENIEKYLTTYSIKDKYEELLTRDLILPCHYKSLLRKFEKLDEILNTVKSINVNLTLHSKNYNIQRKEINLENLNEEIKEKYDLDFTKEDFQKILFITPHFFIYKWDITQDNNLNKLEEENDNLNYDLFIDIPCDILKRMDEKYTDRTNFTTLQTFPYIPLYTPMNSETLKKRFSTFKKILLHLINEQHKAFLKENGIITKLNPFKHRTWHSEFNVNNVKDIECYKLIDKPQRFLSKSPQ